VCELPCANDADCGGAGEICETDAGSCQRTSDCFGAGGGLPAFSACLHPADCACPLSCVDDPALRPTGATASYKFCEQCDGGSCRSVPGQCQPQGDGGFQSSDVFPCRDNSQCTCPNRCLANADAGVLRCEQSCARVSDCNDPAQYCYSGQCVENYCDGQLPCDLTNGRDAPPDAGDGTCLRLPPYEDYVCRADGTAASECDPLASRTDQPALCPHGYACAQNFEGFSCARACALDSDCGPGGQCLASVGLCQEPVDAGPSCANGELLLDSGVCSLGECQPLIDGGSFQESDLFSCSTNADCACPNQCAQSLQDPFAPPRCEQPCQATSDCDDPGQWCQGGQCINNPCSTDGLACDVTDAGDGTCLASAYSDSLVCIQGGASTGPCDRSASRMQAAELCPQGLTCLTLPDGGLGCLSACVFGTECDGGRTCFPSSGPDDICVALDDAGTCIVNYSSPPDSRFCGAGTDLCGCGDTCLNGLCAHPCQTDSDCLGRFEICMGKLGQSFCVPE
jgi:hypothetical protein